SLPPGPLRVVVIILTAGLTWILVSLLLGTQSGFSRLQQLLSSRAGARSRYNSESLAWGVGGSGS
uniref:Uncharacterized protein n=1 Tax=Terrapene triunguis TaxID=2587831 RepID=A0A674ITW8_9SAUR